ncbi:PAS domain S-box protein [Larkinella insperata]|uniref:histidine kinase n=1 Tax=Larkinella insperata TaxID=332158 RepID=A0ABW3QNU1_9BACT
MNTSTQPEFSGSLGPTTAQDYQTLLESFAQAFWETDAQGQVVTDSPSWRAYTGQSLEQWLGEGWATAVHPQDRAISLQQWKLAVQQRSPLNGEYRLQRPDGGWQWTNVRATPILNPDGSVRKWLGVNIDISEKKQAEEALCQQEQRTRLTIEAARMATWEWDLVNSQVYWNEQHFLLLGLCPHNEPLPDRVFMDHLHPEDAPRIQAELSRAIQQQTPYDAQYRMIRQDGQTRWMNGYGRVTEVVDGQPIRMSGVMVDITDRKQAEERLRLSEERLQRAMSIRTVGVIYFDLQGGIHDANEAFQRLSGYSHQALVSGQVRWDELTPPEFMEVTRNAQNEYRIKGENTPYEKQYIRPDGSRWWGLFAGKRVSEGEYVEFVLDITENKQTGQALREANRRKDEFLAMLAHELRNPLASIRLGMDLLGDSEGDDSTVAQTVGLINGQVDHLVRLVDDLLDVSRISRGKIQLHLERVELGALVNSAVQAIRGQFETLHKQLHFKPATGSLYVRGDATRLSQAMTNLLTNGLRYTGEQGQVWVSLTAQGDQALLRVSDNGIGLAADQLTAIFELFVQLDTSLARSQGGLGIGLTLVQRLVDMHGGRVEAHSRGLGQGSEFVISLPLLKELSPLATVPEFTTLSKRPPHQRILVIEDNEGLAFLLTQTLKQRGYEVTTCYNGLQGLEAGQQQLPGVVLCDIGLPELDGYETARQIRQQPWGQSVLLIAISGYGQQEDKWKARQAGFDAHLVKPINLQELLELLEN